MTDWYFYPYKALTGGADGALDSLDGDLLKDFDGAFVLDPVNGYLRPYYLDEDSATAESSPGVISPDSNAGDKRWVHAKFDPSYINVTQSGTGVSTRTLLAKVRDFFSVTDFGTVGNGTTSDQAAVAAAVLEAYTTGHDLFWPDGTYLTTASIANLHSVRHFGPGVIKRGDNSFYVDPKSSHTNTLYCASDGDAGNDGLGTSQALTVQGALTALANYGPTLNGKWDISLAAGTYTETNCLFPIGIQSSYPIYIYGPDVSGHPNIPTAIFDGNETENYSFRLRGGTKAYFQDIKLLDFTGQGGIAATDGCLLATKNVHTTNCYDGILSYFGRLYVSGGVYELAVGNYSAIKSMFHNLHSIGFAYNRTTGLAPSDGNGNGPNISSVSDRTGRGCHLQEHATGHVENCVIDNVSKAFEVVSNSRAHSAENAFSNCAVVYEVESGSNVYEGDTSNNTYNEGGASANNKKYSLLGGGVALHTYGTSLSTYLVNKITSTDITINDAATTVTHHTLSDFIKSDEFDTAGWLKAVIVGDITGTNGAKTLLMQLDGNTVSTIIIPQARAGEFVAELNMAVIGAESQRLWATCVLDDGACVANTASITIDLGFTSAKDLTIKSTLAHADDEINVRYIEIWRGEA